MACFYVSDKITADDVLREEYQTYKLRQEVLLLQKEKLQLQIEKLKSSSLKETQSEL